jgi:hypothetical protein
MIKHALLLSCVLMASDVANAQAPPVPATPPAQSVPPSGCAPMPPTLPNGAVAREGTTTGQRTEPLSDKLAKSDGVLCPPPGVDPAIRAPTPETGNMPVIPPPGSPGGDPNVRPK